MQRDIRPGELLQLASKLCYRDGGVGRPRTINLRQAVSCAYYALFHALALATVRQLVPRADERDKFRLARTVGHAAVYEVSAWVAGARTPPDRAKPMVTAMREVPPIKEIAEALTALRDDRFAADYDHLKGFTKAKSLELVDLATEAIESLRAQHDAGSVHLELFLALIALKTPFRSY